MINRSEHFKEIPLNIVGSSTFGRYPIISIEKTINMFISDGWLVDYAGYKVALSSVLFNNAVEGRAIHTSTKFNRLVVVMDQFVYLVNIDFNQQQEKISTYQIIQIGTLETTTGVVYISENNKPQVAISDGLNIYIYDPTASPQFQIATKDGTNPISFLPGQIDFHDTYFLCAASADGYNGSSIVNNTWRLSLQNNGLQWPDTSSNIGFLQTKPDNTQAVVRFPSKGNMIAVFGETVGEPWFDVGYQLFPYQRNSSFNMDYGCLNPATIARMDEMVVWLAVNDTAGPVIMFSDGGAPKPISTDGIDYFLSNLQFPEVSQGFLYRQDGHIFYHINFYNDNVSLFYDFNTKMFFHASDEFGNYFIASEVAFFNNQYYFVSRNNGNLYAFDTIYETYDGAEIPRIRTCKAVRNAQQEYFIANDIGFTIESGNTNYQEQDLGPIFLITQDGKKLITQGHAIFLMTQDGKYLLTEDGQNLVSQQQDISDFNYLITQQNAVEQSVPIVDLSISIDGGETFSSYDRQYLPPIGQRRNKLAWWQLGVCNTLVCQFRFWGLGRFVACDGVVNIRQ